MSVTEVPLVPPARLAALLIDKRVKLGLDLAGMSRRSNGVFSPTYLEAIERGRIPLDEEAVDRVIDLYEVEAGPVVPGRSKLLLDLEQQRLHVGSASVSFDSPIADAVLERYVSLLYLLRATTPGRRLTLRDDDLNVLVESLGRDEDRLRDELFVIMAANDTFDRTAQLARRRAILGAGLLVGATAIGTLVIVAQTLPESSSSSLEVAAVPNSESTSATLSSALTVVSIPEPAAVSETIPDSSPSDRGARGAGLAGTLSPAAIGVLAEDVAGYDFRSVLPAWQINFAGDSDQWHGVTNSVTKTITIYVEADSTPQAVAEVLMHEVGHAVDIEFMTDEQRSEWVELRDMASTWWTGEGLSDFAVGAGDFAEAVAAYTMGSPSQSVYGEFTPEQMEFVETMLTSPLNQ